MSRGRRPAPRIVDIHTDPRRYVGLAVAADYLGVSERTVRARLEAGQLHGRKDGKVYLITISALAHYDSQRST